MLLICCERVVQGVRFFQRIAHGVQTAVAFRLCDGKFAVSVSGIDARLDSPVVQLAEMYAVHRQRTVLILKRLLEQAENLIRFQLLVQMV